MRMSRELSIMIWCQLSCAETEKDQHCYLDLFVIQTVFEINYFCMMAKQMLAVLPRINFSFSSDNLNSFQTATIIFTKSENIFYIMKNVNIFPYSFENIWTVWIFPDNLKTSKNLNFFGKPGKFSDHFNGFQTLSNTQFIGRHFRELFKISKFYRIKKKLSWQSIRFVFSSFSFSRQSQSSLRILMILGESGRFWEIL